MLTLSEEQAPVEACVHNLSLSGAGLLLERPLPVGAHFSVLFVNAAHICTLTLELSVVRCIRIYSGEFFVGGRFARPLTSTEIAPFLI